MHEMLRTEVGSLREKGLSFGEIAERLNLPLGFYVGKGKAVRGSVLWYWRCFFCQKAGRLGDREKTSILSSKRLKELHKQIKEKNPVAYSKMQRQKALKCLEKHPNHMSEMARLSYTKYWSKHPTEHKENGRRLGKSLTFEQHSKAGKRAMEVHKLKGIVRFNSEWQREQGKKGFRARLRNLPYTFDNESFLSLEELGCYKFLMSLGISQDEINHNFEVDGRFFDFFVKKKFFWEHHPTHNFWQTMTADEYYQKRREILDSSGYSNYPLIVTTSLSDLHIVEKEVGLIKSLVS